MRIPDISTTSASLQASSLKSGKAADLKQAPPTGGGQAPVKPAAPSADTVQISSAAKQALQEATETPAQTRQEANTGDLQAKKLATKEAAAQAAAQPQEDNTSQGAEKLIK
jgi:hypothetical protein